jgi:hypothetical protein
MVRYSVDSRVRERNVDVVLDVSPIGRSGPQVAAVEHAMNLKIGLEFSSLCLIYLVAYSMRMLARYYPSKWLSLLNSGKGEFAFPLMQAAGALVAEIFPRLIVQNLESSE